MPCVLPLFLHRPRARYGHAFFVIYGIGLQFLLSLPAGLAQAFYFAGLVQTKSVQLRLAFPFLAAPFNVGGAIMRFLYEAIMGPPAPARAGIAPGAIAGFHVYLPLLILQVLLVATLFARRFQVRRNLLDPAILGLGALVLVNSLANAAWPWWGK